MDSREDTVMINALDHIIERMTELEINVNKIKRVVVDGIQPSGRIELKHLLDAEFKVGGKVTGFDHHYDILTDSNSYEVSLVGGREFTISHPSAHDRYYIHLTTATGPDSILFHSAYEVMHFILSRV